MREYSHDETSAEFAADFSLFWRVGARIRGGVHRSLPEGYKHPAIASKLL